MSFFAGMEMVNFVKDGMIDDFEMFEQLMEYTYRKRLRSVPEHHPVLMTEAAVNMSRFCSFI